VPRGPGGVSCHWAPGDRGWPGCTRSFADRPFDQQSEVVEEISVVMINYCYRSIRCGNHMDRSHELTRAFVGDDGA
jgi:hypothetical protein